MLLLVADPWTYVMLELLLVSIARRALSVDPTVALRHG